LRKNRLAASSQWMTWSPEFLLLVRSLRKQGVFKQRVSLVRVPACAPYGSTYTTRFADLSSQIQQQLMRCVRELSTVKCGREVVLFRKMLAPRLSQPEIRVLFALLREAFVVIHSNPAAALYSPVTPEKKDPGFNLHADLFLTTKLWLIFEDVPLDHTGASLFLSRTALLRCLRGIASIPQQARAAITALLDKPIHKDSYNILYDLIYDTTVKRSKQLQAAMKELTQAIPLFPGEGYLIDDRKWLHGRTAVSTTVTGRRFHRLTYDLKR
jgi:hypothetical protein